MKKIWDYFTIGLYMVFRKESWKNLISYIKTNHKHIDKKLAIFILTVLWLILAFKLIVQ